MLRAFLHAGMHSDKCLTHQRRAKALHAILSDARLTRAVETCLVLGIYVVSPCTMVVRDVNHAPNLQLGLGDQVGKFLTDCPWTGQLEVLAEFSSKVVID